MSVPGQQSENTYVVHSPISDASARNLEAELTSSGRLVHADWMTCGSRMLAARAGAALSLWSLDAGGGEVL
jgi:hypothetical protein